MPRPEPPWLVEPEEHPVTTMLMAEVTVLEMRHIAEPEHDVAVAKLEHQPRVPKVPEVPRLEVRGEVPEVPEVPQLERPRLSNEAPAVAQLEALVSQMQLRRGVP